MKTLKEFEAYLDAEQQLLETVKVINTARKNTLKGIIIISVLSVLFVVGIAYYSFLQGMPTTPEEIAKSQNNYLYLIGAFMAFGVLISLGYRFFMQRQVNSNPEAYGIRSGSFQYDFKDRVIRPMITFWNPSFKYQINNFLKLSDVTQSGMLYPNDYTVQGSDLIIGEEDGVGFKFSDITVLREKKFTRKNEEPYETVLAGSFFIADFNKTFKNPVYVYPASFLGLKSVDGLQYSGDKVYLEDPEFSKKFNVYSSDQVEARYILTPSMMERMKSLNQKMGGNVHFVFANNNIYIASNNNKDRFEMSWFQSIEKKEALLQYFNELSEQLSIIQELKLNINIWRTV